MGLLDLFKNRKIMMMIKEKLSMTIMMTMKMMSR